MPASTTSTSSDSAASRALRLPSSSRNRRPLAYGGTTPDPTSLLTATTRTAVVRQARTKASMAAASAGISFGAVDLQLRV